MGKSKFGIGDGLILVGVLIALVGIWAVYPPVAVILGGLSVAAVGYLMSH